MKRIAEQFDIEGRILSVNRLGEGFINDTFIVVAQSDKGTRRYILQRKNGNIFKNIPGMIDNILKITAHLKKKINAAGGDPSRETLTLIPAKNGDYYLNIEGEYWCLTLYIEDSVTYQSADSEMLAEQGGRGLSAFQLLLSDFDQPLTDTLPGFHNIRFRYEQWEKSLATDPVGRAASVKHLIDEIEQRRGEMLDFYGLIENGKIPLRVTHNDTKISNILFDKTGNPLCMIDLDTVLKAPCLYDFGDSIRSYANTAAEDEQDLSKVELSTSMYEAFYRGYISNADKFITEIERKYLPFSARYITYEQVLRFLMDYIDGDTYYRIKYPQHNLVRTLAQLELLRSIENKLHI